MQEPADHDEMYSVQTAADPDGYPECKEKNARQLSDPPLLQPRLLLRFRAGRDLHSILPTVCHGRAGLGSSGKTRSTSSSVTSRPRSNSNDESCQTFGGTAGAEPPPSVGSAAGTGAGPSMDGRIDTRLLGGAAPWPPSDAVYTTGYTTSLRFKCASALQARPPCTGRRFTV